MTANRSLDEFTAASTEPDDGETDPSRDPSMDSPPDSPTEEGSDADGPVGGGPVGEAADDPEADDGRDGEEAVDEAADDDVDGRRTAAAGEGEEMPVDDRTAGETEPTGVRPPASTYAWAPGGAPCSACGESVEERWRADDGLVCAGCKTW